MSINVIRVQVIDIKYKYTMLSPMCSERSKIEYNMIDDEFLSTDCVIKTVNTVRPTSREHIKELIRTGCW